MQIKKYLRLVLAITILAILMGIWFIAKGFVDRSYSTADMIKEDLDTQETCIKIEFNKESDVNGREKPIYLFNSSNLETRQQQFLGGNYDSYESVLNKIKEDKDSIFKKLESYDYNTVYNENEIEDIDWGSYDVLDFNALSTKSIVNFIDCLTVVGMYDNTCIVYDYMYEDSDNIQLVVVDYSDTLISTNDYNLFDFGQVKTVPVYSKGSEYKVYDNIDVFYVKGV